MASGDPSYFDSTIIVAEGFLTEYKDSTANFVAITLATLVFWSSDIPTNNRIVNFLRAVAVFVVGISLAYTYWTGRPFGVTLDWTPTHYSDGSRVPDKMSESRGNALIQDENLLIHGEIQFSKFISNFSLDFSSSSDITVELENKPRREHEYDPDEAVLSCENMSERSFPIKLRIYPDRAVEQAGRYHELSFIDEKSDSTIEQVDVIDVRM
ncbi:hypothetical protein [Halorubrum sp. Ib24]|uniref:hypothetical protein n=1 Tax=Halorubrum sp. Ib24 TaxID=1383850 RepID=UPI00117BDA08|nr:hypothetical protein [Halorubrum sp. Ib24]